MSKQNIIDQTVEKICQQGCKKVYKCIDLLQHSIDFDEVHTLKQEQKAIVLIELESIMSVYNGAVCSESENTRVTEHSASSYHFVGAALHKA